MLAEIIKHSKVDLNNIAAFIRANHVEPDWLNMHLPYGRSMSQCIQATEQMAIPSAAIKRRLSNEYSEQIPKRVATSERPEYALHTQYPNYQYLPPPAASHVNILPRPLNGDHREPRSPAPKPDGPRKRGRPSRADKAKRDLHPLLPRPSSDQTSPILHSPHPVPSPGSQNGLASLASRSDKLPTIMPGPRPSSATRPITPPEYVATSRSSASPRARRASTSPRTGARAGSAGAYQSTQAEGAARGSRVKQVLTE